MNHEDYGVRQPFNEDHVPSSVSVDFSTVDKYDLKAIKDHMAAYVSAYKNKVEVPEEIIAKGEELIQRLKRKFGLVEENLREGNKIDLRLEANDLEMMWQCSNNINRKFDVDKAVEYYFSILLMVAGEAQGTPKGKKKPIKCWNLRHLAGKRLEYSYYGFQMLSAQHRVLAILFAMRFGLISHWDVSLELSCPEMWAEKEGQDMKEADRAVIFDSINRMKGVTKKKLPDELTHFAIKIRPRVLHAEVGRSSNSGMPPPEKPRIMEYLGKYAEKLNDFYSIITEANMPPLPLSTNITKALGVLSITNHISDSQLKSLKNPTSIMSSAIAALQHEGFGMNGHNNLHYAVAVFKHASMVTGINHYSHISHEFRPHKNDHERKSNQCKDSYVFENFKTQF